MKTIIMISMMLLYVDFFYGHDKLVHQYIVREAWKLVEYQVPDLHESDIANWIGTGQTTHCLCVVSGAYNEDLEDIIYLRCGYLPYYHCTLATLNHFWDADAGDNSYFNFGGSYENALVKAKYLYYGTHNWWFYNPLANPNHLVWELDYAGLPNFYNTGNYVEYGYYNVLKQYFSWNPPHTGQFGENDPYRKRISYDILGRVCHLIGDMSIPAHAHNDAHFPLLSEEDSYEEWCGNGAYQYSMIDAFNQGGILFDVLDKNYPLRYLFYVTNQLADYFPSDGNFGNIFLGDRNYSNLYSFNGQTDLYPILDQIFNSLGDPPSSINFANQANLLMPFVIRTAASLLLLFAVETDQWDPNLDIIVKNDFEYGEIIFDDITRNSPFNTSVYYGTNHKFKAKDQPYQAPGQSTYFREFINWTLPGGGINPNREFQEKITNEGIYRANTLKHYEYNASINFVNGSSSPGFLKIDEQVINLPYSSFVREGNQIKTEAPPQQQIVNGKTIDYYFLQWNSGPLVYDNPRTFIPEDHFTIQPDYKGHLVSGSSVATGYSSSRKLVTLPPTRWHLVYEDNQSIYYSTSTDGGNSWTPEIRLNIDNHKSCNTPCIEVQRSMPDEDNSHLIGVVWDQLYNFEETTLHRPVFRYKEGLNATTWSNELAWGGPSQHTSMNCRPVLAGTWYMDRARQEHEERFYFLCKSTSGLALLRNGTGTLITWLNPLPGTNLYCNNPTITSTKYRDLDEDNFLFFCWDQNGEIRYSYYNIQTGYHPSVPEILASSSSSNLNNKPCISYDDNKYINVVWEHFNGAGQTTIQHRRKTIGSVWEPIREISCYGHNLFNPSVGVYRYSEEGELILSAKMSPTYIQSFHFNGSEWETMPKVESVGDHVSLNDADSDLMSVWTNSTSGLPNLIEHYYFFSDELVRESLNCLKRKSRKIQFNLSDVTAYNLSGEVIIEIDSIKISTNKGNSSWSYISLDDNLIYDRFFYTVPIIITPEMISLNVFYNLKLRNYNLPSNLPTIPFLKLRLNNSKSLQPLVVLKDLPFSIFPAGSFSLSDSISINLKSIIGKSVYFNVAGIFDLLDNEKKLFIEKTEFYPGISEELEKGSVLKTEASLKKVPNIFLLYPNYPNPFNPTTTISYDLPKDIMVSLEIYDVTGRKIRTLVNEPKEAGTHQVVWNGEDDAGNSVASGLYIYRIQAGDFVQSKKLLFMK